MSGGNSKDRRKLNRGYRGLVPQTTPKLSSGEGSSGEGSSTVAVRTKKSEEGPKGFWQILRKLLTIDLFAILSVGVGFWDTHRLWATLILLYVATRIAYLLSVDVLKNSSPSRPYNVAARLAVVACLWVGAIYADNTYEV